MQPHRHRRESDTLHLRAARRVRVARSVWSAWSLLPLSNGRGRYKAGASSTHSKRFARFGCGCVVSLALALLPTSRLPGTNFVP